ncbi:MAG: hypothetical protein K2Q03_02455 [Sphingobacteriaceae bacterium]|nr:hypothetical protein [Sphingobacteriaceae bacterium]
MLTGISKFLSSVVSLNVFNDHELGMSDLVLPDMFIEPGILLNRDGSLQQSMLYSGADFESTTIAELRYLNAMLYSNAFSRFGDEWCMHLSCLHKRQNNYVDSSECYFPDATTMLMDDERRDDFLNDKDHYINRFILTLTYIPPGKLYDKLNNWFVDNPDSSLETTFEEHVQYFKDSVAEFRAAIASQVYTEPLTDEETLTYLHRMINGFEHKLQPARGAYLPLHYRLATQELQKSIVPVLGELKIGVVSVGEGIPVKAWPGYTHELSTLNFEYAWVTRFIFSSKESSKQRIDDTANYHYQSQTDAKKALHKKMTGFERVNRSAASYADQAEDALEALETSGRAYGNYTCSVIVFDPDEASLTNKIQEIKKVVSSLEFMAKRERVGTLDAYFGTIPGMRRANVRKWEMDTINLADLMPTTDVWHGYERNPCSYYTVNNPPLFYAIASPEAIFAGCTYVGDIGHTFLVGSSRAGKSVAVNFFVAQQFRYFNAQVFHFDNGYSGQPLCFACNGVHYDLASDHTMLNLKPFQLLAEDSQEDFTFLANWLSNIASINLSRPVTSQERVEIVEILSLIKNQSTPEQKTMTYFHYLLSSRAQNSDIARAFAEYTSRNGKNSIKSTMFNAKVDSLKFSRFSMFELEKLSKLGDDIVTPTLEYILYMVERSLTGAPTLILFEEMSTTFKTLILQQRCEDFLRRIAKKNAWLMLCTQQVTDILKSSIADVILDQCKTKIFLPNKSLMTNDKSYENYEQMGLNAKQIAIITSATPQREYYFTNPLGSRLINFRLSITALTFIAKNSPENLKLARMMKQKHGDLFGYYWLKHWELDNAAEYWLLCHKKLEEAKKNVQEK